MPPKHATQAEVAKLAGVHRTTVSLALRDNPNIPAATREKVRRAAEKLGYQPDPMLSALAFYRNARRPKAYHGTLGWLVNADSDRDWRTVSMYEETFLGAKERALTYGYSLEVFKRRTREMSSDRISDIFRSRNIRGILVCPQPQGHSGFEFPWDAFSAVTFGYSLVSPQLHTIVAAHFRGVLQCLEQIRKRGYRRIGLLYSRQADARVSHYYFAAFVTDGQLHGDGSFLPPIDPRTENLKQWYKKHRPDALVAAAVADLPAVLAEAGISAPGNVGVAALPLASTEGTWAGIYESSRHIGATAIDTLVTLVQQGNRGAPAVPHFTQVDGVWVPGRSLP